ncbi:hypothetical protein FIBSPDRAFT_851958, partial [Athelia psychrophila]
TINHDIRRRLRWRLKIPGDLPRDRYMREGRSWKKAGALGDELSFGMEICDSGAAGTVEREVPHT